METWATHLMKCNVCHPDIVVVVNWKTMRHKQPTTTSTESPQTVRHKQPTTTSRESPHKPSTITRLCCNKPVIKRNSSSSDINTCTCMVGHQGHWSNYGKTATSDLHRTNTTSSWKMCLSSPNFAVPNVKIHLSTAGGVPTVHYSMWYYNYLCQAVMFLLLFVCRSVRNFAQKLTKGFAWNFHARLAMGQWTND